MKVGDKVRISEFGKNVYYDENYNPHNLKGVISRKSYSIIYVNWSIGRSNGYDQKELELVSKFKPKKKTKSKLSH